MVDFLTSIRGKRLGLDVNGNLVVNGGTFVASADGGSPVTAASTAAGTLPGFGISTLSTALVTQTLAAPIPGVRKTITSLSAATAQTRIVQTSTANGETFDGTNNKWVSTGVQTLELIGVTTSRYAVIANIVGGATTTIGTFSTI